MKKLMIVFVAALGLSCTAKADSILDQIYVGFVGNAKFAIETTGSGVSKPEFLDNFVEVGSLKGSPIGGVDVGVGGTILPDNGQFKSAEWTMGAKIHLAPFIRNYVSLPSEWKFLGTLEIDARGSYDFTLHHPFYGLVAAYPFK